MSASTTSRRDRGGPLRPGHDRPRRAPAQAAERGVEALRARHRPDDRRRSLRAGWPTCWSSTAAARSPTTATVVGDADAARADHDRRPAAGQGRRLPRSRRRPPRMRCARSGCEVTAADGRISGRPAAVAARHRLTRTTWSRRSSASSATTRCRASCRRPRPAAGSPSGSACVAGWGSRWPRTGYVEALAYPFVGEPDSTGLGLAADDERRATLRIANPLSDEEPLLRTTLLPGLLRTLARNVSRVQSGHRAVRGRAASSSRLAGRAEGADAWASTARRRSRS